MIEAGVHTNGIRDLFTDAKGQLALTVSEDKTARVWALNFGKGDSQPTATLQKVLRPPVGEHFEGQLFAGALSPDGSMAAVAGWTGYQWDKHFCIYLFDTSTGRLMKRFSGFTGWTQRLAFSPSGLRLAAALSSTGMRTWEVASGRLIVQDQDYVGVCRGLDWNGNDTLVAVGEDGDARLYDFSRLDALDVKPSVRSVVKQGLKPENSRFSPDGKFLAVCFAQSNQIAVLDGKTLGYGFAPNVDGLENRRIYALEWSADGKILAAGGTSPDGSKANPVFLWSQSGKGKRQAVASNYSTILGLRSLPSGSLLFCGGGTWGLVSANKEATLLGPSPLANFWDSSYAFALSADSGTVNFGFEYGAKRPARFSVWDRELKDLPSLDVPGMRRPVINSLPLTDWAGSIPKLNGKPLWQGQESARGLAIASDASFFVLGTDSHLRLHGADGAERWKLALPSMVWAVNLSADNRVIVAALGDGTIRWYRTSTAEELLAFFPHADRQRWVMWAQEYEDPAPEGRLGIAFETETDKLQVGEVFPDSSAAAAGLRVGDHLVSLNGDVAATIGQWMELMRPHPPGTKIEVGIRRDGKPMTLAAVLGKKPAQQGKVKAIYYDTSPGGEDLIGWHVNRGKDEAADFFPAAKFRDAFYRPKVVRRVLETLDVAAAAKAEGESPAANPVGEVVSRAQPPVVELMVGGARREASISGATFSLRYRVRSSTNEPVTRLKVQIDGRPVAAELPIPRDSETEASAIIPVPERDCVLSLLAENRFAPSEPAVIRLLHAGPGRPATPVAIDATNVATALKPKLYVLAVGVNDYEKNDYLGDLKYAAKDARDFASVFEKQKGGLFQEVEIKLLTDAGATAADVLNGLDWIKREATSQDVAIVFFAGHAENDEELRYHFCPRDYDPKERLSTGVAMEVIQRTLASIPGKVLFFIDTCHSGNILGKLTKRGAPEIDMNRVVNELSSAENGAVVFASCTGRQVSLESDVWQNGAFTKAIVEGLCGGADYHQSGTITVSTLGTWVAERVKELTGGTQTPTMGMPQMVPDFPIATLQ